MCLFFEDLSSLTVSADAAGTVDPVCSPASSIEWNNPFFLSLQTQRGSAVISTLTALKDVELTADVGLLEPLITSVICAFILEGWKAAALIHFFKYTLDIKFTAHSSLSLFRLCQSDSVAVQIHWQ